MNTNFQKIKELVLRSDISLAEQEELMLAFSSASDADLEPIFKLFSEDQSWIRKISDNYKAKHAAMITGDTKLWKQIVKDEETQLNELEQ